MYEKKHDPEHYNTHNPEDMQVVEAVLQTFWHSVVVGPEQMVVVVYDEMDVENVEEVKEFVVVV